MRHSYLAAALLGVSLVASALSVTDASARTTRVPHHAPEIVKPCESAIDMSWYVQKEQIMDVDFDNTVVVRPVCVESRIDGNATGFRGLIGRNEAMAAALENEQYAADDVVGIQFGDEGVVLLYVAE